MHTGSKKDMNFIYWIRNKRFREMKYFYFFLLIFMCTSCSLLRFQKLKPHILIQKKHSEDLDWKLVWEDEFDSRPLDSTKWTKIPSNNADWGRHMSSDDACYDLSDGKLTLNGIVNYDALKDARPFLTGGIYSKGKFAFQYGKIEIRAKLGSAQGAWPAIWMLAENNKYGAYPRNGEIDIMEHLNYDNIIYQTVHSYYTLELKKTEKPISYLTTKFNPDEFNIFGLEWFPDKLIFTLNGEQTLVYPKINGKEPLQWPFNQPFYILIDQQLGGKWVGKVNPDDLPVRMIVDFVKVYQKQ